MSLDAAMEWVSGNDTGISSVALWRHMMGLDPNDRQWGVSYPHDPDDFGRCYRLLLRMPEWRPRIGEMAKYPVWSQLAPAWDALEALWDEEVGPGPGRHYGKSAPRLYDEMKRLQDLARTAQV